MEPVRQPDDRVRGLRYWVVDRKVHVEAEDGREAAVPVAWYPRLSQAPDADLQAFRIMGGGRLIHWPQLEEALRIEDILRGIPGYHAPADTLDPRAQRLRALRKAAHLTQVELARRLGCSQALVSMAEASRIWVGSEWETRVGKACGATLTCPTPPRPRRASSAPRRTPRA